nr:PREDICTED: uncharacterized protein LOC105675051 [Linepithema humile]
MHILTKILWTVIFSILISETAMILKHTSYNKENKNIKKNILNITLRDDINTTTKVKSIREIMFPIIFLFFMTCLILLLIITVIWFRCPHWFRTYVFDIPYHLQLYRRSYSDQPHVQQLNDLQVVCTRINESTEGNENTEENY